MLVRVRRSEREGTIERELVAKSIVAGVLVWGMGCHELRGFADLCAGDAVRKDGI